jgi:hypothetical protein
LGLLHAANIHGQLGHADAARQCTDRANAANPALTPERYATIITQLTDQQSVRDKSLCGLQLAGLIG